MAAAARRAGPARGWRDQLIWQAGEVVYFVSVWWYLGGYLAPADGGDAEFYWFAIVVRMLAELYLVAVVVRDILLPRHDPVRASGVPSPRPASVAQPALTAPGRAAGPRSVSR